jgi:ribose/xylose/arabinose/galactoside ABC-type transport system permease subunit
MTQQSQEFAAPLIRTDPGGPGVRPLLRKLSSIAGPLIGVIMVLVIFGAWEPQTFLTTAAFRNVFQNNYHILIAAVGATFVIVTGGIDLSVGSTMALASVCCSAAAAGGTMPEFDAQRAVVVAGAAAILAAMCAGGWGLQLGWTRQRLALACVTAAISLACVALAGWALIGGRTLGGLPVPLAIFAGIAVGLLVGVLNGILVTSLTLPPFIVTLATLGAVRGLTLYVTGGLPVRMPQTVTSKLSSLHYEPALLGISLNLWIAIGVVVIAIPLLHATIIGRYAYAIGSNERTARLCGVRVERWKILCYVIAGGAAGLAGALMTSTLGGRPSNFEGLELNAIAAVVIGGTSLFGGEGTIVGSALGVLMLGFLNTGCTIAGLSSYVQPIFIGFTIVIAAAIDRFRHLVS